MRLTRALAAPSADRVRSLEADFSIRFPAAYKDFLGRHNGARVLDGSLESPDGNLVIERFLPVLDDFRTHPEGWADVSVVATQLDARLSVDPDSTGLAVVPIAALFGGDMLVLDYRDVPHDPPVSRWDHEASDDFRPAVRPVVLDFATLVRRVTGLA
jgi:hypothetical protein